MIVDDEEPEFFIGRTQWDSPEVDPQVLIHKDKALKISKFVNVRIEDALDFDLIGTAE